MLLGDIVGTIGFWAIVLVLVLAIAACVVVAMHVFKVSPPAWFIQIFWIVVAAAFIVAAIYFLMSLRGGAPAFLR